MKNGISLGTTPSIVTLPTRQPVNSIGPTGGVIQPTDRLNTITIPNWTGSTPNRWAIGKKIGVKIHTTGVVSMNVPPINKITFIIKKITIALSLIDNNPSAIIWRIPA